MLDSWGCIKGVRFHLLLGRSQLLKDGLRRFSWDDRTGFFGLFLLFVFQEIRQLAFLHGRLLVRTKFMARTDSSGHGSYLGGRLTDEVGVGSRIGGLRGGRPWRDGVDACLALDFAGTGQKLFLQPL